MNISTRWSLPVSTTRLYFQKTPEKMSKKKRADVAWLAPILTQSLPFSLATKGQQRPQTQGMVAEHQAQPTSSKATTATRTPKPQTIHLKFEMSKNCEKSWWVRLMLCDDTYTHTPLKTNIPVLDQYPLKIDGWKMLEDELSCQTGPFSGDIP